MNGRAGILALTLGALVLLWAGLFAYVVVTRAVHDVRTRVLDAAGRSARARLARASRAADDVEVDRILGRLRVGALLRAAADTSTGGDVARIFARHLLRRAEPRIRRWLDPRGPRRHRWRRIAALRVAALGGLPNAVALLRFAVGREDEEVTWAAVRILGELDTPDARQVLVEALREGAFARSRVAAQLDAGAPPSLELLRPLLDDDDPAVRYWGAKLLARAPHGRATREALVAVAADADANVRAAAADSLAHDPSEEAERVLVALLGDPAGPVRLHAARSLVRPGSAGAAALVAALLHDPDWWVRTAAKRSLERLGATVVPVVSPLLDEADEFARNGAAEILQNVGVVRHLVDRVARPESGDRRRAALELAPILAAGGARFETFALEHLDHDVGAQVRDLLDDVG